MCCKYVQTLSKFLFIEKQTVRSSGKLSTQPTAITILSNKVPLEINQHAKQSTKTTMITRGI